MFVSGGPWSVVLLRPCLHMCGPAELITLCCLIVV